MALERVGNLAVSIARLAGSAPPPEAGAEAVRRLIARMGETAIDALALAVQAVAGPTSRRAPRPCATRPLSPMLDQVLAAVAQAPGEPGMRAWSAAAVLSPGTWSASPTTPLRLGARVHFLVTGRGAVDEVTGRALLVAHRAGNDPLGARAPSRPAPTWWRPTSTCGAAGWSCATRAGSARCSGTARASPWSAARLRAGPVLGPLGPPPSRSST